MLFEPESKHYNMGWRNLFKWWPWLYSKLVLRAQANRLRKALLEIVCTRHPVTILDQLKNVKPMENKQDGVYYWTTK